VWQIYFSSRLSIGENLFQGAITVSTVSKFSLFIFVVLVGLTTSAIAAPTYYDILANEFKATKQKISLKDIDRPGHPQARICIEIDREHPHAERFLLISLYTRITQGQGPLLPQITTSKVIYHPYGADVFAEHVFDNVTTTAYSTEIRTSRAMGSSKMWSMIVKKKDSLLLFQRDEGSTRYYGYCFHR